MSGLSRALREGAPGSPWPLALLRVAVCLIVLISPEPRLAAQLAAGPRELWLPPPGLEWFLPLFAWLAPHLWLVDRLLRASALLGLLGLWTRWSLSVLAVTLVILFGGAQLGGAVVHDMHLLWFLLLLGVSPAAQVLSLDAWAKGTPFDGTPSRAAALGTRFARLLLGMVYFFPGLHKLLDSGLGWASSENLQHQLWLKWFQAGGELPWPRIDLWPSVLALGGVGVLVFELSFLPCLAWRRGRALACVMGLSFHALTQHFLYIPFVSLWACYVLLWDGPRGASVRPSNEAATREGPLDEPRRAGVPTLVIGGLLACLVALQGVRGATQSWPFACYPSFSQPAPASIADLAVEVQSVDGSTRLLRIGPLPPSGVRRSPAQWSTVWRLAGLYGEPVSTPRLLAFADELLRRESLSPETLSALRFYVETYAIEPEAYGQPPLTRVSIR